MGAVGIFVFHCFADPARLCALLFCLLPQAALWPQLLFCVYINTLIAPPRVGIKCCRNIIMLLIVIPVLNIYVHIYSLY